MLLGVRWESCFDRLPGEHSSPCREWGGVRVASPLVQEHALFPRSNGGHPPSVHGANSSTRAPEGQRVGDCHCFTPEEAQKGKDLLKLTESGWKQKKLGFRFLGLSLQEGSFWLYEPFPSLQVNLP